MWCKIIPLLVIAVYFFSCEVESNYRFKGIPEEPEIVIDGDNSYSSDGALVFHENFQSWKSDGYMGLGNEDCADRKMITSTIMYQPGLPLLKKYKIENSSDSLSVIYYLGDYAVSPDCGNIAGTSAFDSEISIGFVALQQLIFYECGQHDSDGMMRLSSLSSISTIQFSVSYGGKIDEVGGLTLWKKGEGDTTFKKVGDYKPANPEEGESFTVEINEENVQLKFTPALTGKGNPINDGIDRAVRIHDLWVWSMKS